MKRITKRTERRRKDFEHIALKPVAKTKKKPTKTVRRKAASLLKSLPDITIARRPFMPKAHYFIGGGTVEHLQIPVGWQLSTSPRPEGMRLVGIKVFRTLPHGEVIKLYRFVVRDEIREQLAAKAAALVAAVRADDTSALVARERRTLRVRGQRCPRR